MNSFLSLRSINSQSTRIVFGLVLLLCFASVALMAFGSSFPIVAGVTIASLVFGAWSLYQNDRNGFVRTRQMRRANEPPHYFSELQTLLIIALLMLQGVGLLVRYNL